VLLIAVIATVALFGAAGAGAYFTVGRLPANVARMDGTFAGIKENDRPTKAAAERGSMTFLMVGSDSRADAPTTGRSAKGKAFVPGDQRTDAIMMLTIAPDRKSAAVVSIPRDSWVEIPDRGRMKVNAAYALGGAPLLIRTVEKLTNVRVDHFAIVDFAGFKSIIDAIGGVDVDIAQNTRDDWGIAVFKKGRTHLDGTRALTYVRQRHGLPQGDFDRVKRQQNLIRAVMAKVATIDPVADPVKAYKLLDAGTAAVTVDDGLSDGDLRSLAFSLRDLQNGGVSFLTAPVRGTGHEGTESVVYLDDLKCADLWNALRANKVADYVAANKASALPDVPR
jgi:LCP family protein required for cell wall assembly